MLLLESYINWGIIVECMVIDDYILRMHAFYEGVVERCVRDVRKGKPLAVTDQSGALIDAEKRELGTQVHGQLIAAREGFFLPLLYKGLGELSTTPDALAALEDVADPLLTGVLDFTRRSGGLQGVSVDTLVSKIDTKDLIDKRYLPFYVRPVVLVRVLCENRSLLERIGETSSYFPQRLFRKQVVTREEIVYEIALAIHDAFDGEFMARLAHIRDYILSGNFRSEKVLGKYRIPAEVNARFIGDKDPAIAERELDELYGNEDAKRAVYTGLASVIQLVGAEAAKKGKRVKSLKDVTSHFVLAGSEFFTVIAAVKDYAYNQMLTTWAEKGFAPYTLCALVAKLAVPRQCPDGRLEVYDRFTRGSRFMRKNDTPMNTTRLLPYCAHVLYRMIEGSQRILSVRDVAEPPPVQDGKH